MGLQLSTYLHSNIFTEISKRLKDHDLYILSFVNKFLYNITQVNHRCKRINMELAIESKNLLLINFVSTLHNKQIDTKDNLLNIIKTNDISIISTIKIDTHVAFIWNNGCKIVKFASVETLAYIALRIRNLIISIVNNERVDFIIAYEQSDEFGDDIKETINCFLSNTNTIDKLSFLQYLHSRNYTIPLLFLTSKQFLSDEQYAKWCIENLKLSTKEVNTILSHIIENVCSWNKNVIFWLYDQNYNICTNLSMQRHLYSLAYVNNKVDCLLPHHATHHITSKTIIYDASNNIFNDAHTSHLLNFTTMECYSMIYYLVKYNRFDLYSVKIFEYVELKYAIYLSSYLSYDKYVEYINIWIGRKNDVKIELLKEIKDNKKIHTIFCDLIYLNMGTVVKLLENGLETIFQTCIDMVSDTSKQNMYKRENHIQSKSVYKNGDIRLLRYILLIGKEYIPKIFKYCKLSRILELGLLDEHNMSKNINYALRYGDNEIVNYVIGVGKEQLNSMSLCAMYANNPSLAKGMVGNSSIKLSLCCSFSFKGRQNRLNEYVEWISNIDIVFNEKILDELLDVDSVRTICYLSRKHNVVMDNEFIKRILLLNHYEVIYHLINCNKIILTEDIIEFVIINDVYCLYEYFEENNIKYPKNILQYLV